MNKLISALVLAGSLASAGTPSAPPAIKVEAPQGTFGVKFCNQIVLWVILQEREGSANG